MFKLASYIAFYDVVKTYHPILYVNDDTTVVCRMKTNIERVEHVDGGYILHFSVEDDTQSMLSAAEACVCNGIPLPNTYQLYKAFAPRSNIRIRNIAMQTIPLPVFIKCRIGGSNGCLIFDVIYVSYRQNGRTVRTREALTNLISEADIAETMHRWDALSPLSGPPDPPEDIDLDTTYMFDFLNTESCDILY